MKKLMLLPVILLLSFVMIGNCYAWSTYYGGSNKGGIRYVQTAYEIKGYGDFLKIIKYEKGNRKHVYSTTLIRKNSIISVIYDHYMTVVIQTIDGRRCEFSSLKDHKSLYERILDEID